MTPTQQSSQQKSPRSTVPHSNRFFRLVDAMVLRLTRANAELEATFASRRKEVENLEHVLYDMNIIDSKSAALLTHVSIMLAVVVVLLNYSPDRLWQLIMTGELLCFSLVGMLLLRCVDVIGPPFRLPPSDVAELNKFYRHEVLIRRALYQFMVRAVFVLTLALIAIVAIKALVFGPSIAG